MFIIASLVIGLQLRFVLNTEPGFKTDAIATIRAPVHDRPSGGKVPENQNKNRSWLPAATLDNAKVEILANQIRQLPGIEQVIREWKPPMARMSINFGGGGLKAADEKRVEVSLHFGDENYVPFYGLKLIAGRNLLRGDSSRELLISASFARAMGFADPAEAIGRNVVAGPRENYRVAGVLADFYESGFRRATLPLIIRHNPEMENSIGIRLATKDMSSGEVKNLINTIKKYWQSVFPGKPFDFSFLEDDITNMYDNEIRTERLTNIAMLITAFISCLGLFGLVTFSTGKRAREIGIRKILGATVSDITIMLCSEVVRLILKALLIATPIGWLVMQWWLEGFAYRTPFSHLMSVVAGAATMAIALLTVGIHAMKAAMANPVRSLRME